MLLFAFTQSSSQTKDAQRYEMIFTQVEQAFDRGNLNNIWALLNSRVTIRIEDSLYRDASDIQVESLLKSFFENKDSLKFKFAGKNFYMNGAESNGLLSFTIDNKRNSLNVDVYLSGLKGEILIYAINLSNYPSSTMFYNFYK
jgi:hypothetical protein